jgi:hypothetical protein
MAYKPPKQNIIDDDLKGVPSNEAVFEALKLKLPKPAIDGTNGQLLARGASADATSWVNPPAAGADLTLSNLSSPTAINQNLTFNKATAAIVNGSDAKATQANHDLTIRAGNSGSSVGGGTLTLSSGTSGSGNGGSVYIRIDGGTTTASRRIYLVNSDGTNAMEVYANVQINKNVIFGTDNTYLFGATGSGPNNIANRPQYIFTGTGFYGPYGSSGFISGAEAIYDNATASGSLTVRGGDAANSTGTRGINVAGSLTIRGGDHPGATGGSTTPAAGSVTVRGGNRTAGTGNGGDVTISGGTSVGGTAGSIIANTAGAERMRITNTGDVKVVSGQLSVDTVGKGLSIKEGINAKMGLTGAFPTGSPNTVTVNTTAVTANSRIFLTAQSDPAGVNAALTIVSIAAGTFVIRASNANFNGTVAWMIVEAI